MQVLCLDVCMLFALPVNLLSLLSLLHALLCALGSFDMFFHTQCFWHLEGLVLLQVPNIVFGKNTEMRGNISTWVAFGLSNLPCVSGLVSDTDLVP